MKRVSLKKLLGSSVMFLWVLFFAMVQSVSASAGYDSGKKVEITIQLEDLGSQKAGTVFSIYQVAVLAPGTELTYIPTADFAAAGVDLNNLAGREQQQQAVAAWSSSLPAQAAGKVTAGADGVLVFPDLEQGIYLICQTEAAAYGTVNPFMVALPYTNEAGNSWRYDITVSPKAVRLRTDVEVLKVDEAGNPVSGAELALYDAAGSRLAGWKTDGKPRKFEKLLVRGETYTVKEEKAPSEYLYAENSVFTVGMTESHVKVTMVDKKKDPNYSLNVTKYVMYEGKYRSVNLSFYAALFWDEQCTQRASDVVEIKLEKSYRGTAAFENLTSGTFYLAETDEEGNALDMTSDSSLFTNEISNQVITLTVQQPNAEAVITNHFRTSGGYLLDDDGSITINKTVIEDDEERAVSDTFYFTLYSDEQLTNAMAIQSLQLEEQSSGKAIFKDLAYGIYYIAESDEQGNPVDETFEYTVSLSGEYAVVSDTDKKAVVEIINDLGKKREPQTDDTETESPGKGGPGNNGKPGAVTKQTTVTRASKTGDDTIILRYAAILIAAAGVIVLVSRKRRKNG